MASSRENAVETVIECLEIGLRFRKKREVIEKMTRFGVRVEGVKSRTGALGE